MARRSEGSTPGASSFVSTALGQQQQRLLVLLQRLQQMQQLQWLHWRLATRGQLLEALETIPLLGAGILAAAALPLSLGLGAGGWYLVRHHLLKVRGRLNDYLPTC